MNVGYSGRKKVLNLRDERLAGVGERATDRRNAYN